MAKKKRKLVQVRQSTIGRRRVVGRTEEGLDITEKIPSLAGALYCDRAGSEVHLPLNSSRLRTQESSEKYGGPTHKQAIRDGFLPKLQCPLVFREEINGPLVKPLKGEKPCVFTPEEAAEKGRDWHGCDHYQRAKDARRAKSSKDAARRRLSTPGAEAKKLGEETRAQNALMGETNVEMLNLLKDLRQGRGAQAASDKPAGDK